MDHSTNRPKSPPNFIAYLADPRLVTHVRAHITNLAAGSTLVQTQPAKLRPRNAGAPDENYFRAVFFDQVMGKQSPKSARAPGDEIRATVADPHSLGRCCRVARVGRCSRNWGFA